MKSMRHLREIALLTSVLAGCSASAQTPVRGASEACTTGTILSTSGGPAMPIRLCGDFRRDDAEMRKLEERLNALAAKDQDTKRDVERLGQSLNKLARNLKPTDLDALAESLTRRLRSKASNGDGELLNELDRLRVNMRETNDKVDALLSKADSRPRTEAALAGDLGARIASLDFEAARSMLDGLQRIEAKIDNLSGAVDETNLRATLADATRTRPVADNGQVSALAQLARRGLGFANQDFAGVAFQGLNVRGLEAPGTLFNMSIMDGAVLPAANLAGSRLIAASLKKADLSRASLTKSIAALVQLEGSDLKGADLSWSAWPGANLRGADLRTANMRNINLQHADLRDADLRGADLTGAFLGHADLRGAKLENVIFANTDVVSAVISITGLTAQQRQGLCASPYAQEQVWRIHEQQPQVNAAGRGVFDEVLDRRLLLGSAGHRPYARCSVRAEADLNPWNRPVYDRSGRTSAGEVTFTMPAVLLRSADRRRRLIDEIERVFGRTAGIPAALQSVPQFAALVQQTQSALDIRLRELLANAKPAAPLYLDRDTQLLLLLRLKPALIDVLTFDWESYRVAGFNDSLGKVPRDPDAPKPWPRLFPEDLERADLTDAATDAFRKWTLQRSRAMSSNRVMLLARPTSQRRTSWGDILSQGLASSNAREDRLAKDIGADPQAVVMLGDFVLGSRPVRKVSAVLVVSSPPHYAPTRSFNRGRTEQGMMEFDVRSVRVATRSGDGGDAAPAYLVLEADVAN